MMKEDDRRIEDKVRADIELLRGVLLWPLERATRQAFERMLSELGEKMAWPLTGKQRGWARSELEKWEPPVTRLTAGEVPRGREVEVPAVLRNLPLKPPGRR